MVLRRDLPLPRVDGATPLLQVGARVVRFADRNTLDIPQGSVGVVVVSART